MIFRGADGQNQWKEISQLTLPKGGRVLSLIPKGVIGFSGLMVIYGYIAFQAEANPDSIYGDIHRRFFKDPLRSFDTSFHPLRQIGKSEKEETKEN